MEDLVSAGLVKSIGLSNFNKNQIRRILKICKIPPVVNQIEVNLHWLNTQLIDYCKSKNILPVGYAPLGSPGFMKYVKKICAFFYISLKVGKTIFKYLPCK